MAYTRIVDYAAKDALSSGNPAKLIKGTEIGAEFDSVATADASNVKGPASATDNAIARFDSTTGKLVQDSTITVSDTGTIAAASGTMTLAAHTLSGTVSGGGNQINNVVIGTSTPLAGSFTSLSATSTATLSGGNYLSLTSAGTEYGRVFTASGDLKVSALNGGYLKLEAPAHLISIINSVSIIDVTSTGAAVVGALSCTGALSKGSGSFRIDHPLKPETHQLVHSFIEGPQADLIYRGKVAMVNGSAVINIDAASGMTEGTFAALCREVQVFTTNESGWKHVRGSVNGNILTIECQDPTSTDLISWMVIGERKDAHMYETDWTDDTGKVIVEPLKKPLMEVE